jgi:hypothetical protein
MRAIYMNSRCIKALVDDNNVAGKKISKLSFFQNLVYTEQYDIACVCETCLNDSILDNEILPGYTIDLKDRCDNRRGGGVLVAIVVDKRGVLERVVH